MKIQIPNKKRKAADVMLVYKDQLITEPIYNGGQRHVGAVVEPFLLFHKNNLAVREIDDTTKPEIVKAFYTNKDGQRLESISKDVEVVLVIETRNMIGEEVIVNLTNDVQFEYNKQLITDNQALRLKIKNDVERIYLSVVPQKPIYETSVRVGKYEEKILATYFENEDGESIQHSGWGNRVYMVVESKNMIGKEISIAFKEEGECFKHPQLLDNLLKITIKENVQKIAFDLE